LGRRYGMTINISSCLAYAVDNLIVAETSLMRVSFMQLKESMKQPPR